MKQSDHFFPADGSFQGLRYHEGPAAPDVEGDVFLHERLFTYSTPLGVVAGWIMSVMFSIDAPTSVVWPFFKDFNNWQKDALYSGVVGDLEGQVYTTGAKPNNTDSPYRRQVLKVIPEHLIVTGGVVPPEGAGWPGMPGLGGICPGFSVFMLSEHGGKTRVNVFMEHASYASCGTNISEDEALAPWRDPTMAPEWQRKWREDLIPAIKKGVARVP